MDILFYLQIKSKIFFIHLKQSTFNAGMRLVWVMDQLGLTQNELAEIVKGGQATISNWVKMDKFSKTVLGRLAVLEDKGININFFVSETAPMLKKDVVPDNPEEMIRILEEENTSLKRKLYRVEMDLQKCKEGNLTRKRGKNNEGA